MLGDNLGVERTAAPIPLTNAPAGLVGNEKRTDNARFAQRLSIVLQPSSTSQRHTERLVGLCRDISETGCGAVTDQAPRVGDLYRVEVEGQTTHPLHGVHMRCVRCRLIDEDAFESGFCFISRVVLHDVDAPNAPLL